MVSQKTFDEHPPDRDYGSTILIVDDQEVGRDTLRLACLATKEGKTLRIFSTDNIYDAIDILCQHQVHVILLDKNLEESVKAGEKKNGIDAIPELLAYQPSVQILVVTSSNETQDTVEAMQKGAIGYVTKETNHNVLIAQINKAIHFAKLTLDAIRSQRLSAQGDMELGGNSPAAQQMQMKLKGVSETSRPVLLLGENGTGKTEDAKLIHKYRNIFLKQDDRPFVQLNMGALAPNLLERELFGNEQGAYTGAVKANPGFFELANNGTLFLDEIGDAPLDLQVKLLKVIDEGKFYRVGGKVERTSFFKLICATNKNLEQLISEGKFREDLYMRISTFIIKVPSLAQRKSDIPDIIRAFLPKTCRENGVFIAYEELPEDFIDFLVHTKLRGNIRGIEQQVARLLVLSPKNAAGRPIFSCWRETLEKEDNQIRATAFRTPTRKSISLEDLMTLPMDIVGPSFPGIGEVMDTIRDKIFMDAMSKYKKNKDIAKILKLAPSATHGRIQKLRKSSSGYDDSDLNLISNQSDSDVENIAQEGTQ